MIQIIVVDDHRLFRMGLKSAFRSDYPDICIVGEAESGEALFDVFAATPADLVLLDVNLPGGIGGAETARRLHSEYPDVKILAISGENSAETIHAMLDAGIDGFISKQKGDHDELAIAIRSIIEGVEYFGRDISAIIFGVYVSKKKTTDVTPDFSDRECEVIELCRDGLLCKEIAGRMGVSINTVNTYKKRIFQKLGINNTMEMVQYALKNGIIRIGN
jgi:DNA-binding NarL/FixJ family response regulator